MLAPGTFDAAFQRRTLHPALIARLTMAAPVRVHRVPARRAVDHMDLFHRVLLPTTLADWALYHVRLRMIKRGAIDGLIDA